MARGWLSSVRVLDLSSVGPASRASGILAGYGADVLKIARPRRLGAEAIEPPADLYGGRPAVTVRIDLATDDGRSLLGRLVERADVLFESFRPGVADRLGIDAKTLRARNPRLIYCSTSGYGRTGPAAGWAGHDLNYLAMSGFLACSEPRADGGPPVPGATLADAAGGGMHAAIAVLAALLAREHTGQGAHLDVSATDGSLWLMAVVLSEHLAGGQRSTPISLLDGSFACYQNYRARDGRWLSVAAIERKFWANLCRAIGVPELIEAHTDPTRQEEARRRLTEVFATRDRDEWVDTLASADTCVAPVNDLDDVVHHPQLRSRGVIRASDSRITLGPLLAGMVDPVQQPSDEERLRSWGLDPSLVVRHATEVVS
ncbi:MAG TPA: CoA transferase [Acidimicrobiales bacterium]